MAKPRISPVAPRRSPMRPLAVATPPATHGLKKFLKRCLVAVIIIAAITYGLMYSGHTVNAPAAHTSTSTGAASKSNTLPAVVPNPCADNALSQLVLVSVSQQHFWACEGSTQVYNSAVITGMELYPADLTPTGTYHIYAKATGQTLAGHDNTGSWSDYVYYWMPFLDNQYGTYGFHDLTQQANGTEGRADSDFGNININAPYTAAKHGSHGCVETPLTAMKWFYNWAQVGTTVTVES